MDILNSNGITFIAVLVTLISALLLLIVCLLLKMITWGKSMSTGAYLFLAFFSAYFPDANSATYLRKCSKGEARTKKT